MIGAIPWKLLAKILAIALVLGAAFFLGYRRGDEAAVRLVHAADAKVLASTVNALEAQFKLEAADRARVQSAFDQWRIDHAEALAPVNAPDVRLCVYRIAPGGGQVPGTGAAAGAGGATTSAAGGSGKGVRPADPQLRGRAGPNFGPLFVALGALLDDTSAYARSCRAAGR